MGTGGLNSCGNPVMDFTTRHNSVGYLDKIQFWLVIHACALSSLLDRCLLKKKMREQSTADSTLKFPQH